MAEKTREKCGKRIHVMFYPDAEVYCNRLEGHPDDDGEGGHRPAPADETPEAPDTTGLPELAGPSGVLAPPMQDLVGASTITNTSKSGDGGSN